MDRLKRRLDPRTMRDRHVERGCYFDKGGPPAAPPPPNPSTQILAQARAMPSSVTPYGTEVYSGDPTRVGSFTRTQTLSPEQQQLLEGRQEVAQALLDRSQSSLNSLPAQFNFEGDTDPATNQFFQQQRRLLDETFEQHGDAEHQRLANQGLPEGSEAYREAMDEFTRRRDDSYESAATNSIERGYRLSESERQQQLNEIAQALGGQIIQPQSAGNPIDTQSAFAAQQAGLNRQYQGDLAGFNANQSSNNSTMAGIATVAAAFI